ncbi:UPF0481 protein At3g47200-like [Camellia sinensis]|uniref:UPF0481 protein At3g47200-like n=1 Tax=Camellia sinensis TaxID=4442 RepID=UPI001036A51E|nr:UPF0481 protein At3g47200-like [Camellia sinensis]
MKESIEDAKKCYALEVEDVLDVEMLLIDGCFVLELLYRYYLINYPPKEKNQISTGDPIFSSIQMCANVQHDLILLKNQRPFFILEKLFPFTLDRIPDISLSLSQFVILYFGNSMNYESKVSTIPKKSGKFNHHILHLLQNNYLPDNDLPKEGGLSEFMHSASEFDYAGVKFMPDNEQGMFNFKVKFSGARGIFKWCHRACFEIPSLCIYDFTEPSLRNIIALKQCCPGVTCLFTSYAFLMDRLIDNAKHVGVLGKAGVICNY